MHLIQVVDHREQALAQQRLLIQVEPRHQAGFDVSRQAQELLGQRLGLGREADDNAATVPGIRLGAKEAPGDHGLHHATGRGIVHPYLLGQRVEGGRPLLQQDQHDPELLDREVVGDEAGVHHVLQPTPDSGSEGAESGLGEGIGHGFLHKQES